MPDSRTSHISEPQDGGWIATVTFVPDPEIVCPDCDGIGRLLTVEEAVVMCSACVGTGQRVATWGWCNIVRREHPDWSQDTIEQEAVRQYLEMYGG